MAIPSSVDELTPAWFSEVLDADIAAVDVLDAHSGTTGRAKVRLDSGGAVPDTLFVKLQPFDAPQRDFLRMIGLGVAEARLYAAVGHELPVRTPRVWHSSFDDADGSFIMVLEDLEAAGCRFASPDDDDVLDVAASLVEELALLHATYWGQELRWLGVHSLSPGDSKEGRDRMAMGASILQSAVDQFADDLPPAFRELGELYVARNRDVGSLWNEGERTLIHGDDHIGNLFVDGGRTGFYDWAVASRYPGMRDVAYFLTNSLPTELRRAEEDALLARYRAALAAAGVELDEGTVHEQYRLFSVYSWIAAATTAAMGDRWQPAEIGRRATVRTTDAIIDLDVLGLLRERLGA
jgi:aminoglycoside phosphotransferase (APT) family kinase protein